MARGRGKLTPQDYDYMKTISENINSFLKSGNYKQVDLVRATGIPASTLTGYVKGTSLPVPGNVQKIADFFGVLKSEIDPRFKPSVITSTVEDNSTLQQITDTSSQLDHERQLYVLDTAEKQLQEQNTVQEPHTAYQSSAKRDERFTVVTDQYRRLNAVRKEVIKEEIQKQISEQNIVRLEDIRKRSDLLSQANSEDVDDVNLYGEVSAGTGVWISDESIETVLYPKPIPRHDIALRVKGNSMEPLFQDGEIVFVHKTPSVNSGQIIIIIVNNEAYIKKLYKRHDEVRLISLNSDYDDIILTEYDQIEVVGIVVL